MFPLLRLPYSALENFIDSMDMEDQFALSKVSKRSQRIIKCCVRRRKYEATISFDDNELSVNIRREGRREEIYFINLDNVDADLMKSVIAQVTNTFNLEDLSLSFHEGHYQWLRDVIPVVKKLNVKMGTVFIGGRNVCEKSASPDTDKFFEFIFQECNGAKRLYLSIPTTPNVYPKRGCPCRFDTLVLTHASWLRINYVRLWFMNCKRAELVMCTFTSRDMNLFMKEWRKGSEFQNLGLEFKNPIDFTLEDALADIPKRQVHNVKCTEGWGPRIGRWSGYVVQQDGGVEIFVCITTKNRLDMTTEFKSMMALSEDEDEDEM